MKEWAKEFYHSKDWTDTRRAYLIAQHYLRYVKTATTKNTTRQQIHAATNSTTTAT